MKRSLTTLACTLLTITLLQAQPPDRDGDLYIPPDLSIGISQDMSWLTRLYGTEAPNQQQRFRPEFRLERTTTNYNTYHPLPIIFFDQASSVLPERYLTFNRSLDADDYRDDQEIDVTYEMGSRQFAKYREILNIIGYRLSRYDSISVDLMGGYSTEPGESPELARERSEVVAEYLINVWRIDSSRVRILPPQLLADSSDNILAQEEARSVRIYPSHYQLLEPLRYPTTQISMQVTTISIGLAPNMSREDIARARLVIASGDDILGETSMPIPEGEEFSPISWTGLWFLPRKVSDIDATLSFNVVLETYNGSVRASNTVTIPVIIDEPEREYGERNITSEEIMEAEVVEEEGYDYPEGYGERDEYEVSAYDEGYDEGIDIDNAYSEPTGTTELRGELTFFSYRDTTLGRLQELMLGEEVEEIHKAMSDDTTTTWRIAVEVDGDLAENPEADDATLRTGLNIYQTSQQFGKGFFNDPTFQISLYILPEVRDPDEEVDQELMIRDMVTQMYGDRAPEINRMQEEASKMYNGTFSTSNVGPLFDSILVARGRSVAGVIAGLVDTARLDSVGVKPAKRYTMSYNWLPEERFYARSLTWELYRSDSYRWQEDVEEYDQDEYDYDYENPYEDWEHEEEDAVEHEIQESEDPDEAIESSTEGERGRR